MISDTLDDAVTEIENYQREMPHVYDEFQADIEAVTKAMKSLSAKLNNPGGIPAKDENILSADVIE